MRAALRTFAFFLFVLVVIPAVMFLASQTNAGNGQQASLTGVVVEEHGDDFVNDKPIKYLTLVTDRDRYSLTGPGAAAVRAGQHVAVGGRLTGGTMYLPDAFAVTASTSDQVSTTQSEAIQAAASTSASPQTKRVAVLLINFVSPSPSPTPSPTPCATPAPTPTPTATPDPVASPTATPLTCPPPTPTPTPSPTPVPPPTPWTTAQVAGYYFNNNKSVASFYREVSNGSLTVTGGVFGWFTLTMKTDTCDYNGFATAARAAATASGVDLSTYTNIVYASPRVAACSWGGLGVVNGPYSWINGTAAMGVYVPSHELGHNFGSHHASSLTCKNSSGTRVQYSNSCTASEYGDPFDLMGSNASSSGGIHHENTWARRQIGVLTTADQQTVTASGTYSVTTAQVAGGVPRILRVLRPSGDYYYLEFRQPYGTLYENWDPTSAAVNGVMIRIAPNTSRVQSKLVDCHPETATFTDATCRVGERFVDKVNSITIITRSIGPGGAAVYIQVGPDVAAPTAPSSLTGAWTGASSVSLGWGAASDEIGVTGYRVSRDGTFLTTVSGSTRAFVDATAPANTMSYSVAARDAAGNVGPPVSVIVGVADTVPPGPPADLAAAPAGPGTAQLTWAPATDNTAVSGYDISVDGVTVATVGSLSFDATGLLSTRSYSFAVAALDDSGNVGPSVGTSYVMPDLVAPSAPRNAVVSVTGKTSVTLTWSAAADDVGVVGYQVSRGGVPLRTVTNTSFRDSGLSPATNYSYAVAAVDAAGNVGPPVGIVVVTLEATPPSVTPPALAMATAGQLDTTIVPVVVAWSAADPSGVAKVELQQSKNGGAWSSVTLPSGSATSVTLWRAPGDTFRYRARATDSLGNTSAWAAGPTAKVMAKQEGSAAVAYSGTWSSSSVSSAYGGGLKHATTSTARARFTFTGRSVAWVAPRAANRGRADVYVDGVFVTTVDLYSATSLPRSVVFSRTWASSGPHTLQIRVKATSGRPRVDVDGFVFAG